MAKACDEKSQPNHTESDRKALLWGAPVKDPEAYAPGTFGCHEALHMASSVMDIVDSQLMQHPAILLNPKYYALAEKAHKALFDLHQAIGEDHLK